MKTKEQERIELLHAVEALFQPILIAMDLNEVAADLDELEYPRDTIPCPPPDGQS
jgi:hypothetical protein